MYPLCHCGTLPDVRRRPQLVPTRKTGLWRRRPQKRMHSVFAKPAAPQDTGHKRHTCTGMQPNSHRIFPKKKNVEEGTMEIDYRKIAELLGRNVSTISRELNRNFTHMYDIPTYYPHTAQKKYLLRRSYCHRGMFQDEKKLEYIKDRLKETWSPEQIASTPCEMKMPSTRTIYRWIYESNGVKIRDFVPVLDMNGTPCMFDKVEQKFYYNQGTGDFIAGPVIGGE